MMAEEEIERRLQVKEIRCGSARPRLIGALAAGPIPQSK
jgi:hypothetical protein